MICCSSRTLRVREAVEAFFRPLFDAVAAVDAVVEVEVDAVVIGLSFFVFVFSVFWPSSDEGCLDGGVVFSLSFSAAAATAAVVLPFISLFPVAFFRFLLPGAFFNA